MGKISKCRIEWIDIVKGIGILLMVIGHAGVSSQIKVWIYGFHMPLFFISAGYLYSMFDDERYGKLGFSYMLRHKAEAYLIPYTVLFFVNLFIQTMLELLKNRGGGYSVSTTFRYLLAGVYSHDTAMPNCAPLWFLTCLFVAYIFFWNLITKKKMITQIIWGVIYMASLIILYRVEAYYGITQLPWHIDVALIASLFMLVGYYMHKCENKIDKIKKYLIIICLFIFMAGSIIIFINGRINMVQNQYQNIILFIIGAAMLSFAIMTLCRLLYVKLNPNIKKALMYWGRDTLIFMGFNYTINLILRQIFKAVHMEQSMAYSVIDIIVVMAGCSIAIAVWHVIQRKACRLRKNS